MKTTELIEAIRVGDRDKAKMLIANGANVNEVDERGWSALFQASGKGYIDVVKLLLKYNADINLNGYGWTALFTAAAEGHIDIVKLLLENGAKTDVISENTRTDSSPDPILFYSIGYPDITRLLLQHGADINAKDTQGYSVLASALELECIDTAYILLEHISEMSDIDAQTEEGHTALMYAEINGYADIANILKNAGGSYGNLDKALINTAGMTAWMDMIKFLVKKGANVNAQDEDGMTAMSGMRIHKVFRGYYPKNLLITKRDRIEKRFNHTIRRLCSIDHLK